MLTLGAASREGLAFGHQGLPQTEGPVDLGAPPPRFYNRKAEARGMLGAPNRLHLEAHLRSAAASTQSFSRP